MIDYFENEEQDSIEMAYNELKRADHLIFVSLKYTRTVDVIKNIFTRFINFFEHALDAMFEKKFEEKAIQEIPKTPGLKIETAKTLFNDDEIIKEYLDFYSFLRKINRADYTSEQEFRRHVKMTVNLDNHIIYINIDKVTEYYEYIKEFYKHVLKVIER